MDKKAEPPRFVRVCQDEDDQTLLNAGWSFQGFHLFSHPTYTNKYFRKPDALRITDKDNLHVYCTGCGFPDNMGQYTNCNCKGNKVLK